MQPNITTVGRPVDPFAESSQRMALVAFPKSTSKRFPFALSIAQQASRFEIAEMDGARMHVAYFTPGEREAKIAVALLSEISDWKGVMLYSKGQRVKGLWNFVDILNCYLKSCRCTDPSAHCFVMIDDPKFVPVKSFGMTFSISTEPVATKPVEVDRYVFPCSRLHPSMKFQHDHPSSLQDQIQAAAVRESCHLCPRFDPTQFRKVGSVIYQIEA